MAMMEPILLPALRGQFGDWVYYAGIMPLSEVNERIGFARELHQNERLGELIQRQLQDFGSGRRNRASDIANYLRSNDGRFFNAIVVGIYGGEPVWHPFDIQARPEFNRENIDYLAEQERVGFLELRGTERLFALDGQHRVAGIKKALENGGDARDDIITVLFVPHINSATGIQRTRRLFVDLNKRAIPVGTKDIIILDEVDLPAILARRLVDEHEWFARGQVDIERFTATIPRNSTALFSIATLFNVIKRILPNALASGREDRDELRESSSIRLPEERVDYYYQRACMYFEGLANTNQQLREYLEQGPESGIAVVERDPEVRNALFRPAGQVAFASAIAGLAARDGLESALRSAQAFPTDMALAPFAHVIWDPVQHKMISSGSALVARLLKYMCGLEPPTARLRISYRTALRDDTARLPNRLNVD